ncbi:hypothetical protein D3C75_1116250 [compost metagenome]
MVRLTYNGNVVSSLANDIGYNTNRTGVSFQYLTLLNMELNKCTIGLSSRLQATIWSKTCSQDRLREGYSLLIKQVLDFLQCCHTGYAP